MWNEKDFPNLQKAVNLLLSDVTDKGILFKSNTQILLKEIQYSSGRPVKRGNLIKALVGMKQQNQSTIQEFISIYQTLGFGSKLFTKTVKVFFPFANKGLKKEFVINGQVFRILKRKEVFQYFEKNRFDEYIKNIGRRGRTISLPNEVLFLTESGETINEIWGNLINNFSILQGIFDWSCVNNRWVEPLDFRCRTQFIHPKWILTYHDVDGFGSAGFNTNEVTLTRHNISKNNDLKRLLNFVALKSEDRTTRSLIYDCFRLYAQATEAVHKHNFYLSLWQLIESACLGENHNGNTQVVIKRINLINEEIDTFGVELTSIYYELAHKRNTLVHKGIDSSDMIDGNILLVLAENCIRWLYMHEKKLKTKTHIEEYFRLKTRNTKDRQATLETIDYLNNRDIKITK